MTLQAIIALAGVVGGILTLILYAMKRADSPEVIYQRAVKAYEDALKAETEAIYAVQKELDKLPPDGEVVRRLAAARHAAGQRVLDAKAERDRLRPRG